MEPRLRELINEIVADFYKKTINDVLIGYHFIKFKNPEILEHHLERLTTFWEMQLTGQISVPLEKPFHLLFTHLQLNLNRGELGRWIILFSQTLDEVELKYSNQNEFDFKKISDLFKNRISFFEERFKLHPNMFQK